MKKMDEAFEIAKGLAKTLIHNKELLEDEELLATVIGCRYSIPMSQSYRNGIEDGKNGVIVNDLSSLQLKTPEKQILN